MSYFVCGSGRSVTPMVSAPRFRSTGMFSRGARPRSISTSRQVVTGRPEIRRMRSSTFTPARSAGLPVSTCFTTGEQDEEPLPARPRDDGRGMLGRDDVALVRAEADDLHVAPEGDQRDAVV